MRINNFWQIKNEISNQTAEILLYGDISESTWWGDEVTPKQFADDLAALNGKPVTVRINSPGGDVFAAHTIYNQLKSYKGGVTVQVDGLAASAASIVMMAGERVIMPSNAMVMIHNPMLILWGYYDSGQLEKMSAALDEIKESIINAYLAKSSLPREELSSLMDTETWMSAATAKEYGFADEIKYPNEELNNIAVDGNFLVVNSVRHDMRKVKNSSELRKLVLISPAEPKNQIKEAQTMEIKTVDELQTKYPDLVAQIKNKAGEEAISADRERLKALDALTDPDNPAVQAIITEAKNSGKTAAEIQPIVDIIKEHAPAKPKPVNQGLEYLNKIIGDNKNSGVDNIKSDSSQQGDEHQEALRAINYMTQILDQKNGRVINGTGK